MISLLESAGYIGQTFPQALGIPWGDVSSSYWMKTNGGWEIEKDTSKTEIRALVRTSHVNACLDTWFKKAPFGTYNVTHPGFVSTAEVLEVIKSILKPDREFVFWENDADFYNTGAVALRSNCIMDSSKPIQAGIKMRPVNKSLESALIDWNQEK